MVKELLPGVDSADVLDVDVDVTVAIGPIVFDSSVVSSL